jgi:ubiquinone/menaquinone biosynthesis C-methylase UbiE
MTDGGYYLDPALYDAVYSDVTADIAPHVAGMRVAGGPALEMCCGNGRLLIPTLEAGIACEGLDREESMLADLRRKLAAKGLRATLHRGDMRDFTLPMRYALITIPFNSFLHNLTQDDQLATLRCCRQHLENGGRLQLTAFQPSAAKLLEWSGEESFLRELPWGERRIRVYDRANDDRVEQVRRMTRRIEVFEGERLVKEHRLTFDLRYVYKPEMELLLRVAGFPRWEARPRFADYRDPASSIADRPIQEGDIVQWTAWKD